MANSVVTNSGAMAAIRSLFTVDRDLKTTSGRIESGLKVNKASDDPAVFAIAQGMRGDMAGLRAVQDGMAFGKAVLSSASSAAKKISDELNSLKQTITQGQQQGLDTNVINAQITKSLSNIDTFAEASTQNNVNLLSDQSANGVSATLTFLTDITGNSVSVDNIDATTDGLGLTGLSVDQSRIEFTFDSDFEVANGDTVQLEDANGNTWTFEFSDGSAPLTSTPSDTDRVFDVQVDPANQSNIEMVGALINKMKEAGFGAELTQDGALNVTGNGVTTPTATFASGGVNAGTVNNTAETAIETINAAIRTMNANIATLGATDRQVTGLQEFSKSLMDSMKEGLGALVDADLAEESANLQALQTRQQLAIQSLSIANQGPQALLGLFR